MAAFASARRPTSTTRGPRRSGDGHPAVTESGRLVGSLQVQNRAGLGGNICNAAPSADAVPVVICLDARAEIAGPEGATASTGRGPVRGPGPHHAAPDEFWSRSCCRRPGRRARACYLRFTPRREMDIAIAGAGAWIDLAADGTIADARMTLASVAPVPLRATAAEERLKGERPSQALVRAKPAASPRARPSPSATRADQPNIAASWSQC